ncbi:hypothetical protein [Streptomyces sp. DH12]|jgi:hypothetical protein|uniref:hypothetical protein n=1 Tax=Streptomyces sp. DH12 TaxID=2857010 RepID=UPI001E34CB63|nr:hypothetical protein [Streptomyces sp. DH12]
MGLFRRSSSETPATDDARTRRLLDRADDAFECEPTTGLDADFQSVVMEGLMTDKAAETYPPTGHGYPRR